MTIKLLPDLTMKSADGIVARQHEIVAVVGPDSGDAARRHDGPAAGGAFGDDQAAGGHLDGAMDGVLGELDGPQGVLQERLGLGLPDAVITHGATLGEGLNAVNSPLNLLPCRPFGRDLPNLVECFR